MQGQRRPMSSLARGPFEFGFGFWVRSRGLWLLVWSYYLAAVPPLLLLANSRIMPGGPRELALPSSGTAASGMDNTARRKFQAPSSAAKGSSEPPSSEDIKRSLKQEKNRLRREADPLHNGTIAVRENIRARAIDLNLDAGIGKTMVVSDQPGGNPQAGGYYCAVCDCTLKDSLGWLDHINGRKHQHALGLNLRSERSTVEQVRAKLARLKAAKLAGGAAAVAAAIANPSAPVGPRKLALEDTTAYEARARQIRDEPKRAPVDATKEDDEDALPPAKRARGGGE